MVDFLGELGKLASPLEGALNTFTPNVTPGGGSMSLGSMLDSIGRGAQDVVAEGPGALVGGAMATVDPTSGMSARDRLFVGGLTALGAGMIGREAYRAWKSTPSPMLHAPSGYQELTTNLGDPQRFAGIASDSALRAQRQFPGLDLRRAEMVGADDADQFMHGFRRWDLDNAPAEQHARFWHERYTEIVGDPAQARHDWAKFDWAVDRGVFSDADNAKLRGLWGKLRGKGELSPAEGAELMTTVRSVADATAMLDDDLSFGLVGRVEKIILDGPEPAFVTSHPNGWSDGRIVDPDVRFERMRQLNYRQLTKRAEHFLTTLYEMGKRDYVDAGAGVPGKFHKRVELGPEWYATARKDVAKEFGLDDVDSDALERAVAATSFLSEAEDWATNIPKAKRAMEHPATQKATSDPLFMAWLKDPKTAVSKADEQRFKRTLSEVHGNFTSDGMALTEDTMGVILRLLGTEPVEEVFASTQRRKQRNFYLNIYKPDFEYPVTIDRHAFDIFLGMDSGIKKRPIDQSVHDGEEVYDVVADTYRRVAERLQVPPHALQAVTWEMWRILKEEPYQDGDKLVRARGGWNRNDPFRMPEADGSENLVYQVLNGRHILNDPSSSAPGGGELKVQALETPTGAGLKSVSTGGSVTYAAKPDLEAVARFRHLFPGINGADGIPRWVPSRPLRTSSARQLAARAGDDGLAELQLSSTRHPAFEPGDHIVYEGPPLSGRGFAATSLGRAEVIRPALSRDRLRAEDISPDTIDDPKLSPFYTHDWAVISAERPDMDNLARTNKLRSQLNDAGYHPIEVDGKYGGDSETSFLVFGIDANEAKRFGDMYDQDSVLLPGGYLYGSKSDNPGMIRPPNGEIDFNAPELDNRSVMEIGGRRVRFAMDFDWDDEALIEPLEDSRRAVASKSILTVPPGSRRSIVELAEELERKGATNVALYTNSAQIDGFERAYESVFDDGVERAVVRTRKGTPGAPNMAPVFVRSAAGLPEGVPSAAVVPSTPSTKLDYGTVTVGDGTVQLTPGATIFDIRTPEGRISQLAFRDGTLIPDDGQNPITVSRSKDGAVVNVLDDTMDLTEAIHLRAALAESGLGLVELKVAGKSYTTPKAELRERPTVNLLGGIKSTWVRRDERNTAWQERFGFDGDFSYRVANKVQRLPDPIVSELEDVTARMVADYGIAFRRWNLPAVVVSPITPSKGSGVPYSAIEWDGKIGGRVILNQRIWSDPDTLAVQQAEDRAIRLLTPRADGASALLAHEYGHMIHLSVWASQSFRQNAPINQRLAELAGGKKWKGQASRQISDTAGRSLMELVAESFSEVYGGSNPSELARKVVALMSEELNTAVAYRKAAGL